MESQDSRGPSRPWRRETDGSPSEPDTQVAPPTPASDDSFEMLLMAALVALVFAIGWAVNYESNSAEREYNKWAEERQQKRMQPISAEEWAERDFGCSFLYPQTAVGRENAAFRSADQIRTQAGVSLVELRKVCATKGD